MICLITACGSLGKLLTRQFILDKYGYLGRGNRKVVPSRAVWQVRAKFLYLAAFVQNPLQVKF